jgi:hypothetical protein
MREALPDFRFLGAIPVFHSHFNANLSSLSLVPVWLRTSSKFIPEFEEITRKVKDTARIVRRHRVHVIDPGRGTWITPLYQD